MANWTQMGKKNKVQTVNGLTRRKALSCTGASLLVFGLGACSSSQNSDSRQRPLTPEGYATQRFAALAVRIGDGPEAPMLLVGSDGRRLRWLSRDRIGMITENGRIVKTMGLKANLVEQTGDPKQKTKIYDLDHPAPHAVPVQHVRLQPQSISSPDQTWFGNGPYDLLEERLKSPEINWTASNRFIFDSGTKLIVASSQHPVPFMPPIHIRLLKPARISTGLSS